MPHKPPQPGDEDFVGPLTPKQQRLAATLRRQKRQRMTRGKPKKKPADPGPETNPSKLAEIMRRLAGR